MMQLKLAVISLIPADTAHGICLEPLRVFRSFASFFPEEPASGIGHGCVRREIDAGARAWAARCLQLTLLAQLRGSRCCLLADSFFGDKLQGSGGTAVL